METVDRTRRSRVLAGLCYAVAAGVLTQAVLAGLFLSGTGGARVVHIYVGWVLTYVALAVPVVALVQRGRGRASRGLVAGGAVLPVALWVQEVLGAMPNPVTTVIHVPLGVSLFAYAVLLGLASTRPHSRAPVQEPPAAAGPSGLPGHGTGEPAFQRDDRMDRTGTLRLAGLLVAGLVVSSVAVTLLVDRDPGLGLDELLVAVAGVGLALLVEYAGFRRRR